MPYDPDEISEIKKLLDNSITNSHSIGKDNGGHRPPETDGKDLRSITESALNNAASPVANKESTALRKPGRKSVAAQRDGKLTPVRAPSPPTVPAAPARATPAAPRSGAAKPRQIENETARDGARIDSYDVPPVGRLTEGAGAKRPDPELDTGSSKFKVNFDFEGAYKDVPENRPLRRRREKRTGCLGGILYAAFVICVSLVLASLAWMAAVDVLGFGESNEQVDVTVPKGFTMDDITNSLYDAGLIKYKFLFNLYAGFSKADEKISAGSYVLNKNFDYRALVQGMTARAGARVETTVTIPEGYTLAQIFKLLEDYGVCPASDLWETATNYDFNFSFLDKSTLGNKYRLEGFLFPETYNFYIGSTPVQAITKFLREFDLRFTEQYTERAAEMGYSVKDIVTVASMIEREAGSDDERPRIAAVIYNRLKSKDFPYLQIDSTIYYAISGTDHPFSTDFDSPYNTYTHEGLPPGPIANPGIVSIRAALYPDSTSEYYYALNKNGTHNFFKTLAQHQAFVQSDAFGG